MADIEAFQKKLAEICTLAKLNGKRMTREGAALFFKEDGLGEEQLDKVLDYLRVQGIRIIDEKNEEKEPGDPKEIFRKEPVPLSPEEESYLREYRASLKAPGTGTVLEDFLWRVVEIAGEFHYEAFFIGDLIQEGNLSLMAALEELGGEASAEALEGSVRRGLQEAVEAQSRQKGEDDFLVERVRHLEESIRDLTEDVGEKFSIEELSAYLDMEEEEIRAVLRLTGDGEDS